MKAIVAHGARDLRIEDYAARDAGSGELQIKLERGGICGSDLHYYNHGGFGTVRLREPMALGHEIAGRVVKTGSDVSGFESGQRVSVSPSRPCRKCEFCLRGQPNHCLNMRFYGSAMPFPHIQGAFRELLTVEQSQCANAESLTACEAAMAEPLAVCIHAARRAGNLVGKRVLITGCGPIGLLCVLVAQCAGAREVAVTDIADFPLARAEELGANHAINVSGHSPDNAQISPLAHWHDNKGYFDTLFECSGVASALVQSIPALRPGAVIVQLGLGGDMTLPMQQITAKELQLRGSFRFHNEFFTGVSWMAQKRLDVAPLVTHTMPMQNAVAAFDLANDRSQALKVHLRFND